MIAVDEVRPDFPQVACFNLLVAHHAAGSRSGRSPVHQHEPHAALRQKKIDEGGADERFILRSPGSVVLNIGKMPVTMYSHSLDGS